MRVSFVHMLVALLIAIFAIGSPLPAQADCAKCDDCSVQGRAKNEKNEAPCQQKGLACQIAQTCATQLQKMPVHAVTVGTLSSGEAIFGEADDIAVKLALLKPETSPPRA